MCGSLEEEWEGREQTNAQWLDTDRDKVFTEHLHLQHIRNVPAEHILLTLGNKAQEVVEEPIFPTDINKVMTTWRKTNKMFVAQL